MEKRELTGDTKRKILLCAANILRMHARIAGDRMCQDWSGSKEDAPETIFTAKELDDISFNYEIYNSGGDDYSPEYNGLHDEMVISFSMAEMLGDLAT